MLFKKRRGNPEAIYTTKTVEGRSRCVVLAHVVINSVLTWLTSGMFYTSFLMVYGISIVNVGIITFVPYIAACFSIFSPAILERFSKRKTFLAITRALYYILNILGVTLVPLFVKGEGARIIALVTVVFLASIVNAITGSGYTAWHIKFVPVEIRADYFAIQSLISGSIGIASSVVSGLIADALSASVYADTVFIIMRYVAFGLAMLDVVLLCLPPEFAYEHGTAPKLKNVFTLPFRNKPFITTVGVTFLFTFFTAIPSSSLNYYLINDVGVKYTFIYLINLLYPLIQLFLLPVAKKFVRNHGWFETFGIFVLLDVPTLIMYSCVVKANYLWLYTLLRILQHFTGTFYNLANSNLAYINMPREDQTNYYSFQTLASNVASFLGMMLGTGFVAWCGEKTLTVGKMVFTSVQMLHWGQLVGYIIVPIFIFVNLKTLKANNN